jgi:hypothetical protein
MFHTWRVKTLLIVPKYQSNQPAVGETSQYASRLPEQARNYGGIPVAVRKPATEIPIPGLYPPNQSLEQIELVADVQVPAKEHSFTDAVERFSPVFGTLVDLLAFDMAVVPGFGQVDMVDISPPVSVGDERFATSFSELPFDRYMRSNELLSSAGRLIGELPESVDGLDSKASSVLRWYVKASSTNVLHDQFMFLWIALEILCGMTPSVSVRQTYKAPCTHEIPECPECGKSTAKKVEGSTKKAFLQQNGVSPEKATELWRMRQMMHGAIKFDSKEVVGLSGLVPPLRAVVAAGLKKQLGKTEIDLPIVAPEAGYTMHPAFSMGGQRPVTAVDISPLIP